MRVLVAIGVALGAAGIFAVALAARGGDRSACGEVGDRERVTAPGGGRVAFVRCAKDGSAWLHVAEGGRARRVAPASYGCCYRPSSRVVFREPSWSPDGRRLAVVVEDVGGTDVWTFDPAGRSARRVTSGPARERSPGWSGDGRGVTFVTETGEVATVAVPRG